MLGNYTSVLILTGKTFVEVLSFAASKVGTVINPSRSELD